MNLILRTLGLAVGALGLLAAAAPAGPQPTSTAAGLAAPDAGAPPRPAAPTLELPVTARAIAPDGGVRELKAGEANEDVAPESRFELETPALQDVRVRLFDEADRVVASEDQLELGQHTRYRLRPAEPLEPASRYQLRVDGLRGDYPSDAAGRAFRAAAISFRTGGEKPAPAPKRPKAKKTPPKKRAR